MVVLDSGKKVGRKILMSGGGFCNFTNLDVSAGNYLSQNRHFVKPPFHVIPNGILFRLSATMALAITKKS
ncbi:NAD(P)/FAD-dependent oxidoreductase [Mannheimia haemolytica]|nr:NAD(P)/FAD-dependent oxidoreductase [Mannheimia haemolytica]